MLHDIGVDYTFAWNGGLHVGVNKPVDRKPRFTVLHAASSTSVDADFPSDRLFYVRNSQAG